MQPTDLTVSVVVEQDDRFLMVEERSSGIIVLTQPGGHVETGESPQDAAVREAREESGCEIAVSGLLGVYLWIHPQTRRQFLRIVYTAELVREHGNDRQLDDGIFAVHWYSFADIKRRIKELRTPVVLRCIQDYVAGQRQSEDLLAGMMPIQQHVSAVMANAHLV